MVRRPGFLGPRPGRVLGLYALAVMERDGPVYGYQLAERIAERTDGAWRPGAGAIYPALNRLVERGLARSAPARGRRMYSISPRGRAFLRRVRTEWMGGGRSGPDLSRLWAEISGAGDAAQHVLHHVRRHLESLATMVEQAEDPELGSRVMAELRVAESRVAPLLRRRRGAVRPRSAR
jgi:DNA-binding PadR family transcriptional regulator